MKKKPAKRAKKTVQKRTIDKRPAFLKAFVASASLTEAAKAVGIDRSVHYDWLKEPAYAEAFAAAREQAAQTLEDDAVHWARTGIFEPLVYQGQFQYAQRPILDDHGNPTGKTESYGPPLGIFRRSEGLMGRLLKAFMPARYAERGSMELSGKDGQPIETAITVNFVRPTEAA